MVRDLRENSLESRDGLIALAVAKIDTGFGQELIGFAFRERKLGFGLGLGNGFRSRFIA